MHVYTGRPDLKARRWTNRADKKNRVTSCSESNVSGASQTNKRIQNPASLSVPALPTNGGGDSPTAAPAAEGNEYTQSRLPRGSNYEALDITQMDYVAVYTPLNV